MSIPLKARFCTWLVIVVVLGSGQVQPKADPEAER